MISEFELIGIFKGIGAEYDKKNGIIVPSGDDCAVFNFQSEVVTSVDSSIENVHFPANAMPNDIAYRAIAIALSDLAAMCCSPRALSISITSEKTDKDWYEKFAQGIREVCNNYELSLIGGDITKGPLNINVTVFGVPLGNKIVKRNNAKIGDEIFISSQVGRARKGLKDWKNCKFNSDYISDYMHPKPKFSLAKKIYKNVNACIDTSDGLIGDLKKILTSSSVGADIYIDDIPITSNLSDLDAGDDYDLCFTMPPGIEDECFFKIGTITKDKKLNFISKKEYDLETNGFDHFKK